jgi:sugar phosphate isomerase/epimerase|tara:strand:+ start:98 stop:922 length:825 start_codon:yes stop_codon:yes gene_type:complete
MYRTSISNIAWGNVDEAPYLEFVASKGLHGIEFAPSVRWEEPVNTSGKERSEYRNKIESFGLKIVSLHALLYARSDLMMFSSKELRSGTAEYLVSLASLAASLGCGLMVLGSPKNRTIGDMKKEEADKIAEDFFYKISDKISKYQVVLCIEPLSNIESDYINNHLEGINLVKNINHPNFRLMLDVKSMYLAGENYEDAFKESESFLEHIHVNDPGNKPPGSTGVDHSIIAAALRQCSYDKTLSLEVGRSSGEPMDNVQKSIDVLLKTYCQRNND